MLLPDRGVYMLLDIHHIRSDIHHIRSVIHHIRNDIHFILFDILFASLLHRYLERHAPVVTWCAAGAGRAALQ